MDKIIIKGAKENNLKNIDIEIPRNKIVCFVGVSGSGKSTIAFDIIAREGQRQYFESLSSFARRYLAKSNRPDIEDIKGLSSTVIISQEKLARNPRSTVGTVTECYTYLRLLYARCGLPIMDSSYFSFNHPNGYCPKCKGLGKEFYINPDKVLDREKSISEGAINHHNWKPGTRHYHILKSSGKIDIDKKIKDLSQKDIDFLLYCPRIELSNRDQGFVQSFSHEGIITRMVARAGDNRYKSREYMENPLLEYRRCSECDGGRLKKGSLEVMINNKNIGQVANIPISNCIEFIEKIDHPHAEIIKPRLLELLRHLKSTGVGYLSLNRSTDTLSGGESQRVKMSRQLGCDLVETIYVLDEPTVGLAKSDIYNVINNLKKLRDSGNSVLVIEHDREVIRNADFIIEIGPGGGDQGGKIVFCGEINEFLKSNTLTARCLQIDDLNKKKFVREAKGYYKIRNARKHNLKNININLPKNVLIGLCGVSGSGKSSLVEEIKSQLNEKIIVVDQTKIGASKRGCIATYAGIFDSIRKLFSSENKVSIGKFSYNSSGGCSECKGIGYIDMDMNFLGNVKIKCTRCKGKRYENDILKFLFRNRNIVEVLDMTVGEACKFFKEKEILDQLELLDEVGLSYIKLGQSLDTLSGGESQRLKLVSRLQSKGNFYILDEPTSGLHMADVKKLLILLDKLVDSGNTVLVVEHNSDVLDSCDYLVELGPKGGEEGGYLISKF